MDQNEDVKSLDDQIKELKKKRKTLANNTPKEKIDGKKLQTGLLNFWNPVLWLKDLTSILNIRKLIIYSLIIGSVFGYGYLKGIRNKPVHFDMRGKEAHIALNEHVLHVLPDGTAQVEEKDGTILKRISTKDIPQLRKALKPIGFQLDPIGIMGLGVGDKSGAQAEGGAGVSWFKFYNANLDTFLTNKGLYPIGVSYRLHKLGLHNSSIGIAGGKGFKGDTRGLLYFRWKF